jgi:hypothetical protein
LHRPVETAAQSGHIVDYKSVFSLLGSQSRPHAFQIAVIQHLHIML